MTQVNHSAPKLTICGYAQINRQLIPAVSHLNIELISWAIATDFNIPNRS